MKLRTCVPQPVAWASAGALFVFAMAVSAAMAVVLPPLFDLMERSPRLAWLGVLLTWLAPIAVAATFHRAVHFGIDVADSKPRAHTSAGSFWAGFVAWATILFVSLTTSLFMLMLDPPPVDRSILTKLVSEVSPLAGQAMVRTIAWVVLAAYVYELERRAREASETKP
jgi:hypothetical protein